MPKTLDLHGHDFNEIVIVTNGSGKHFTPATHYDIERGDVFAIPQPNRHGYASSHNMNLTNVIFRDGFLNKSVPGIQFLPGYRAMFKLEPEVRNDLGFRGKLHVGDDTLERILCQIAAISTEMQNEAPGWKLKVPALFAILIIDLCREYENQMHTESRMLVSAGRAAAFMEEHFDRTPLTLDEICRNAFVSVPTLLRHFKKACGTTPMQYLEKVRLKKAAELLENTRLRVSDVAFACGFASPNYFARRFQAQFGRAPSLYRRDRASGS